MSILFSSSQGWVISHEKYIKCIYNHVVLTDIEKTASLSYSQNLFCIINPFIYNDQASKIYTNENTLKQPRKRKKLALKRCLDVTNSEEVSCINKIFNNIIQCAKKYNFLNFNKTEPFNNNADAREISERFFKNLSSYKNPCSSGSNTNDYAIATNCFDDLIIFPANSNFYCCDVKELFNKLESNTVFDFILMDPPWWNKYIRRKNLKNLAEGYKMMYNHELKELPIKSFLSNDGLLAIWCTNSSSHINDVMNILFPNWGIEYCATWYWMKVTKAGESVCNFSKPPGKQPYERIIFGSRSGRALKYSQPEEKKVIVSVPSAIHSHKPPLIEVLASYLPTNPACLELFARYLLPNWTSCGNQVMSLQKMELFTQQSANIEPS